METTTEFRSHWVAADGTKHASRRDASFRLIPDLQPVLNIEEVRGWLTLSTSDEMLRLGFPGGDNDARVFYTRQFLRDDVHPSERERLAPLLCEELTDDVPMYHHSWRQPFVDLRNRWPGVGAQPVA